MKLGASFELEKIDKEFLLEMSDKSDYWESCYNFVINNWERDKESFSPRQLEWADRILEDCIEYRIEGWR